MKKIKTEKIREKMKGDSHPRMKMKTDLGVPIIPGQDPEAETSDLLTATTNMAMVPNAFPSEIPLIFYIRPRHERWAQRLQGP
jgi:hypothetical protein